MSVDIGIENDMDQSMEETYECDCSDFSADGMVPMKDCPLCHGKGTITFRYSKWHMNVCNSNFSTLMHALGIDTGMYRCHPSVLMNAIKSCHPELAVRSTVEYEVDPIFGCHSVHHGIDADYVKRQFTKLFAICQQAAKMEEFVCWG